MTPPLHFFRSLLRLRDAQPEPSRAHTVAHRYWASCSNTFITNPEYYDRCEAVLTEDVLPRLGSPHRVLDVGCGSGRYTLVLATIARFVDACDLSPALIAQARRNASERSVQNIAFRLEDITYAHPRRSGYDLVSCMGVLSTIVDDWAFRKITAAMRVALRPGGLLLLRDSVSRLPDGELVESDTYATRYRNEEAYRNRFAELGLTLVYDSLLAEFGASVNRYYLYRAAVQEQ